MDPLVPVVTWTSLVPQLQAAGENQSRSIARHAIGHPLDEEFEQRGAASDGSHADYARCIGENTWLVVREFADSYVAQVVRRTPAPVALVVQEVPALAPSRTAFSALASLPSEAPGLTVGLGAAIGALGGAPAGAKWAAVGALIGGGAALAAVAVNNAASSPETAQVAQNMFLGLTSAGLGGAAGRRTFPVQQSAPARGSSSRADRFDRADFEIRYSKPTGKK